VKFMIVITQNIFQNQRGNKKLKMYEKIISDNDYTNQTDHDHCILIKLKLLH